MGDRGLRTACRQPAPDRGPRRLIPSDRAARERSMQSREALVRIAFLAIDAGEYLAALASGQRQPIEIGETGLGPRIIAARCAAVVHGLVDPDTPSRVAGCSSRFPTVYSF